MNAAECDEMIGAAAENRVKLQVGFMRRFDESFMAAKEQVDLGIIGRVVLVKSLTRGPSIPQQWQYDISASNGTLAEVNSHDIDTLRWLTASEFQELHAIAGNYRCPDAREDYPDFYDNVSLLARFDNNCQGIIDGAVSVGYGYDARVEILGTKGVIFVGRKRNFRSLRAGTTAGGLPRDALTNTRTNPLEAAQELEADLRPGDLVLIKGRSTQHLERIALVLQGKRVGCTARSCRRRHDCATCPLLQRKN